MPERVTDRARFRPPALVALGLLTWALWRTGKVEVTGHSMHPTLAPGDRLLVLRRGGPWRRPRPGDLVTLRDPRAPQRELVKRLGRLTPAGADLRGDAAGASTDSRVFGPVPAHRLTGRAVYRYGPPERAGRLRS